MPDKTPTDTRRHDLAFRLQQAEMALVDLAFWLQQAEMALDDVTVAALAMEQRLAEADALLRASVDDWRMDGLSEYLARFPEPIK